MNTLKMKVLLMISNNSLQRAIIQGILIWMATCLTGCLILYSSQFLAFPPLTSMLLSLIFSSPALLIAIPFLYHLTSLPTTFIRIALAVAIILITSAGVIGFVAVFFNLRYFEVAESLLFFIPAALGCFFLIAWKQLIKKTHS